MNRLRWHDERIVKLVHEQLGRNIDADIIKEVAEHLKECPDCHIYIDSVHQTINLLRTIDAHHSLPKDVENRIYKSLKLDYQ